MRRHIVRLSLRAGMRRASFILATPSKLAPRESTYLTFFLQAASKMSAEMIKNQGQDDFPVKDLLYSAIIARNLVERAQITTVYHLALCDMPTLRTAVSGARRHMQDVLVSMRYMPPPAGKRRKK